MAAIERVTTLSMTEAEAAVRAALGEQGFGVLTEIDVAATLKARIDVDRAPMKILGACNPTLANRALQLDPEASLLLPCNVVLSEVDGGVKVAAIDPLVLMPDPAFAELAAEAAERLSDALAAVPEA